MSRETATPGHRKFPFHHTFVRPARTISAEGCSHTRHICISRRIWASRHTRSPQRVARTQDTVAFHDTFGRPGTQDLHRGLLAPKTHLHFTTHLGVPADTISAEGCLLAPKTHLHFTTHLGVPAGKISAEGCSHPRHICISRHISASRHARSPQRVACTQDTFAFHNTFGRPGRHNLRRGLLACTQDTFAFHDTFPGTQDLRRGLLAPKTQLHFTTHLGVPARKIFAEGCSHPRHICTSRHIWASRHARSPQRVARTQDTFAFHDTFGRPGRHDLRRGLLAPKTHLHFTAQLGIPAGKISAESCSHPIQDTVAFHDKFGRPGTHDLAEGCSHPRHICISRRAWASRQARSPQRVAGTQDTFAFHDTFGRPGTQDLHRGLLAPKTHLHFTTHLGVPADTISAEACSDPRHICISRHIWESRHARSPQWVAHTQDTFALNFTTHLGVPAHKISAEACSHLRHICISRHIWAGRPGTHDLRRGLLAPKTHLHFTTHLGVPARKISAEGCSHSRYICISRHIWASRHTRSPQRVART